MTTQAGVNLAAIARNCARLLGELHGGELCAVVKADGYGHGMVPSAEAALVGGASWLAVAGMVEARDLVADEKFEDLEAPLLLLGPICSDDLEEAIVHGFDIVVWSEQYIALIEHLAAMMELQARVHIKLDSGMGRFGTRDAEKATRIAQAAATSSNIKLIGLMTHFATADELDDTFFDEQLERFASWVAPLKEAYPEVVVHAANSAATLRDPRAHFDMVRCGIAIYGMDPFGRDPAERDLEPALEVASYLAAVKLCRVGESAGYGRSFTAERDTYIGVVPIGYGDGWRRGLSNNAEVLIDGRRHPLVGTVSMDSITIDLGPDPAAEQLQGLPVVLIGAQGEERITAEEVAGRLDTISYEITCGLTRRLERRYCRDGEQCRDD
ncbi:MAG TPA: alanine racemase [Solirubrobacteraceae bacterium]|nr:alanine racemase [Solirubrobacteraceae bacterium]